MNFKFSAFALACLVGMSFSADPRMEQGARFEAQGNYEMALGEYRAILAENPKSSEAYFAAAEVRVKMKDYSGALANYRLAYKFEPAMSAAYEGAAKVYEALGQKAKADAERAKDPKNNPVAETQTAETSTPAPAATAPAAAPAPAVEQAKAEVPKAAEIPKTAEASTPAPAVEPTKAETPKAAEAPKVAESPKTVEAPKTESAKAEPVAKEEAPKAVPADPFERGKALFAEKNYKEAAVAWREVLKKQPGHAGAYFYAGMTRYELGEYDKAEFNLKKGLEYKEEGNDANFFLACVYQKTNKSELELKFLANYLKKAGPTGKYRKAAEERLAALKAAKAEAAKTEAAKAETVVPAAETAKTETPKSEPAKKESAGKETAAPAVTAVAESSAPVSEAAPMENSVANANMLFGTGSYEAALQMYKALLETEQNPEERYFTMLQLGNVYRELRDFHSAVTRYREVVQQFPDSDWASEAERALEDAVWLEKHSKELPKKKR